MDEVTVHIDAPPDEVWALVTDVTRMGQWSPECIRCVWLDGATGPKVGARFKGTNRRGIGRWSTVSRVVVADETTHFAFDVDRSKMRWGYRFVATADGGTDVTEYREHLGKTPPHIRFVQTSGLIGRNREQLMVDGMRETLARVKAAAEAAA